MRPAALIALLLVVVPAALGAAACSGDDDGARGPVTSTSAEVSTTLPPGPPAGATEEGLRSLTTGACFDLITDDDAAAERAVWLLDCADPHTYEVYDVLAYEGGSARGGGYPGQAQVQDWAEGACFSRFEAFVGIPWTRSELEIQTWWPSEESWGRSDRSVICAVFPESGDDVVGTLRASER